MKEENQELLEIQDNEADLLEGVYRVVSWLASNTIMNKKTEIGELLEFCAYRDRLEIDGWYYRKVTALNSSRTFSVSFGCEEIFFVERNLALADALACHSVSFTPFNFKVTGFSLLLEFLSLFADDDVRIAKIEHLQELRNELLVARDPSFTPNSYNGTWRTNARAKWNDELVGDSEMLVQYIIARNALYDQTNEHIKEHENG